MTLTSSIDDDQDGVCPGDTVVFICTHTGPLLWISDDGGFKLYLSPSQVDEPAAVSNFNGIFILKLIDASNNTFESTATAYNVSLNDDGVNITCTDDINNTNNPDHSEKDSINLGLHFSTLLTINFTHNKHYSTLLAINFFPAPPPSPPLNVSFFISCTPSIITISWVAPLDTPLCVHSYTVTISNSSQVMVYNTTDTSLNITDLTPGNEYSVTVAGRDGAGRLGGSKELFFSRKLGLCVSCVLLFIFSNFFTLSNKILII